MKGIARSLLGLAVAGMLVTACRRHEEPPPENTWNGAESEALPPVRPAPAPEPPEPATPPPSVSNLAEIRPAPEDTPDQQVLDDADATGMTSRVSRDGESGNDQ